MPYANPTVDSLTVSGLSVMATIGVHEWEQRIKQPLFIDLVVPYDFTACEDDRVESTLDYDALCRLVVELVEGRAFRLIETVANEVAAKAKEHFQLAQIVVSVSKPHAIANAKNISVTVVR